MNSDEDSNKMEALVLDTSIENAGFELVESEQQALLVPKGDNVDGAGATGDIIAHDDFSLDPIERITKMALRMSDLTYDRAFAIDVVNLGNKLGEYTLSRLTEILFDRIYKDETDWFMAMFAHVSQEDMAQYMADYLVQRFGGDPYYSANKGIPAMIMAHMNIDIQPRAAERWLDHFEEALEDMQDEITMHEKGLILDHMRYAAYFLVAAQVQQKEHAAAGIQFFD